MNKFQPHIIPVYPPSNFKIFEEWVSENYNGCNTDRELIPAFFTSYWVNNDYGNNQQAKQEMQDYIDGLDRCKKWFCVVQYDDSVLIDFKDLDVLRFEMSKNIGITLPLICQPHSIRYDVKKKYLASFVGSITHPIRQKMIDAVKDKTGYYISTNPHSYDIYNKIISESMFCLAPRGYGLASFRCYAEAVYQGSVPVYISDEHIIPFDVDFNEFGVLVRESELPYLDEILVSIEPIEIIRKQGNLSLYYDKYFSYEGCLSNIENELQSEYYNREKPGTDAPITE